MAKYTTATPPTAAWHHVPVMVGTPKQHHTLRWIGAAIVGVAILLTFIFWPKPIPSTERLIVAVSATQEEGFPGVLPDALVSRAQALANTGGGEVVGVVAAGGTGQEVSDPVSLRVETDGQLEYDAQTRENAITTRLAALLTQLRTSTLADPGRSLTGLLDGVSAALGTGKNEVWLETFGMPTVPGEDTRLLTAADPEAAAKAIPASAISHLPNTSLHIVLLPPAGNQPALNATTDMWRRAFVADVVRRTGASVIDLTEDTVPSAPMSGAPAAPPVPNIVVNTTVPKTGPVTPTRPLSIHLDTATAFAPDTAHWATGPTQVEADLMPVIKAWAASKGRITITISGFCARFGPADGAVALSQERADKVAALLRSHGVTVIESNVVGKGYASPLPDPNPTSLNNRTVIVAVRTTK